MIDINTKTYIDSINNYYFNNIDTKIEVKNSIEFYDKMIDNYFSYNNHLIFLFDITIDYI
jgi:hypothetical protein